MMRYREAGSRLDDECFAQFYERKIAGGRIAYMEKHLANSADILYFEII